MTDHARMADELNDLMGSRARVRGGDLASKLRRAPRALPRHMRRDAEEIARAAELSAHPKLARQVDGTRLSASFERIRRHLGTIDPREARKTALLNLAAAISFVFIALATAALFILVHEGVIGPQPLPQ